jgi:muramoyltetrapeptide carboxypeptidase
MQQGFRVEIAPHTLGTNNYFSGTVEERLSDFQNGINHPEAKAILCARGGYGSMQILDLLDWTKFEKRPKIIIGFSDITTFHIATSQKNIPSLHASMPLNFASNTTQSLTSLVNALKGNPENLSAPFHKNNLAGNASGQVIGGNLAMIHALLTRMKPSDFNDKILFLEDVGENLYQVDRMMYGLQYSGALNSISGLILGGFTSMSDTDQPFGKTVEEIILSHVDQLSIPVGFGFPCGHQDDNQAIVFGMDSKLSVIDRGSSLIQPFFGNLI